MSIDTSAKRLSVAVPIVVASAATTAHFAGYSPEALEGVTTDDEGAVAVARIIAGAWILAIMLSLLAEVSPGLSKGFSILIAATALLVYGGPLWSALEGITATANRPASSLNNTPEAPGAHPTGSLGR